MIISIVIRAVKLLPLKSFNNLKFAQTENLFGLKWYTWSSRCRFSEKSPVPLYCLSKLGMLSKTPWEWE